jgi:choline dehydrogenase
MAVAPDVCDFVVVGAGSAGCVVAERLSRSGKYQVIVLEAGREDDSFWMPIPLGYGKLYNDPRYNWMYESEPEEELNGKRLFQPRGKTIGGTSSINGMVYVRGARADFDKWRDLGAVGWGYEDVLPYFKRTEDNVRGVDKYHNVGGPLPISDIPRHILADAFIAASAEAGYPVNSDFNGKTQEGFGYSQLTVKNGRRWSAADAYLHPARRRPNLRVVTKALATRIVFEGKSARGVEYFQGGQRRFLVSRFETVVCGGVFNSPQLLQLSGIGPADPLNRVGIALVLDRPQVGANLQDHFGAALTWRVNKPITLNDYLHNPLRRLLMGVQYFAFHKGPMASNAGLCQGFIRSSPALPGPNLAILMWVWSQESTAQQVNEPVRLQPYPGMTAMVCNSYPDSRGTVMLKNSDPHSPPEIRFNNLGSEVDKRVMIEGIHALRRIMSMPTIASYLEREQDPGADCVSDADLLDHIRRRGRATYHATSTCRMGSDGDAVVDCELRVRGVDKLRVIDASVMPHVISGNTNAATMMIAEKGSDLILANTSAKGTFRQVQ